MSDGPIVAIAGAGAALMAAAGALDTRVAIAGVATIFVAAAWKFVKARNKRNAERRSGEDRRHDIDTHPQPPVAVGSR